MESCKSFLSSDFVKQYITDDSKKWWSDYIFHFSDLQNVANILEMNQLHSRNSLLNLNIDFNDIASKEVINGTDCTSKDFVRFYFRPLTPTQNINEGIHSKRILKNKGLIAHCPVPVFLLFDAALLDEETTSFSKESLASHYDVTKYNKLSDLKEFPFNLIYHNAPFESHERDNIIKHRHAEILIKDSCDLSHLKKIICRNIQEAHTLMNYIGNHNPYFNKIEYILDDENSTIDKEYYASLFRTTPNQLQLTKVSFENSKYNFSFNMQSNEAFKLTIKISTANFELIECYDYEKYKMPNKELTLDLSNIQHTLQNHNKLNFGLFLDDHLISLYTYEVKPQKSLSLANF